MGGSQYTQVRVRISKETLKKIISVYKKAWTFTPYIDTLCNTLNCDIKAKPAKANVHHILFRLPLNGINSIACHCVYLSSLDSVDYCVHRIR